MAAIYTPQRAGGAAIYGPMEASGSSDTTPPTLTGAIAVGTVRTTSIAVTWPAGSDNVAVTSYEVSSNNGTSYTDTGSTATSYTFTGLSTGTSYTLRVRAKDAAGNLSTPALSVTQSTSASSTASDVWGYILSNGLSAEQNIVDIRAMLAARPSSADIATAVWSKTLP